MAISMIRTLIIFFALMAAMRLMGKRQLGELEPSELVVAVLISDLASHPLQDPGIPLLYGLVPVITLLSCEILISGITMRSIRLRSAIYGKPSILISAGKICQAEMRKNRVTLDELMTELRKQGTTRLDAVQYGILETSGSLSILLYPKAAPATPEQLEIPAGSAYYPVMIINDGRVLQENLRYLGRSRSWLEGELKKRNIPRPSQVYWMTADREGTVQLQEKEKEA